MNQYIFYALIFERIIFSKCISNNADLDVISITEKNVETEKQTSHDGSKGRTYFYAKCEAVFKRILRRVFERRL